MAEVTAQFPVKLEFLFRPMRYKVAHGGRGCLAPGSKVIMADGSLRSIEDVSVGDLLMGPDSKPRTVLKLFRGREQMYRVKQTSAQDYVVNGAHILVLRKSEPCRRDRGELFPSGNFRRPTGRYPDFPDEVEISVEDWLKKSDRWKEHFRGFRAGVSPNKDKMLSQVSIEPVGEGDYFGVLLDGDHRFLLEDGTVTHNSGKSWGFARALLILGAQSQTRVICAREVQKSIKESVHRLLSDQIQALGLGSFYEVLETEIRGRNGTTFSFSGLASHTVESIKSFEGADICWVEEAQSVSKRSWDILTPTIRKADSEIWVSFNPELDTDETYKRFVVNKPDNCTTVEMNYSDNPWFSDVLDQERLHCQKHAPEDYDTIWLGRCRSAVVGAIYAKEMEQAQREGRITHVPHDPKLRTHVVFDLGWNDSMVVSFVQRLHSSARVIDVIKDSHRTLDSYAAEIKSRDYRLGTVFLPHDGYHKDYKTGKSAEEILKRFGFRVRPVSNISIEAGIKAARQTLAQSVFDKTKAAPMVDALKRYRRAIHSATQEPGAPLHDDASHGADNYRYIALCAEQMTNEDEYMRAVRDVVLDPQMGY